MSWFISNADLLQALANLFTLLGVPVAIALYVLAKRKEIRDRENGTYDALDSKYQEYLHLCIQHPDLPLFDSGVAGYDNLSDQQKHQLQIAYCMLISIFERAYLMYRDQRGAVRRKQWLGWELYIEDYLLLPHFAESWRSLSSQFDSDFVDYLNATDLRVSMSDAVQRVRHGPHGPQDG